MATASKDMITKLNNDATAVKTVLAKMQKKVDKMGDAVTGPHVAALQVKFGKVHPQIEKFARDAARDPAILAKEDDYKKCRKFLTNVIGFVQKTSKAVDKEVATLKNEITVQAVSSAEGELLVNDKKLAQALKMVARGDKGRSGPVEAGVKKYNHIHVGGNANDNLLFQPAKKLILGTLNFHLEAGNSKSQKAKIKSVAGRSGSKITLAINGDVISKK